MGKIYYMMGKSSSGKDTIYKDIRKDLPELKTLTLYTTRPMREGEKDGVEYYFVTDEILEKYREEGKIIGTSHLSNRVWGLEICYNR